MLPKAGVVAVVAPSLAMTVAMLGMGAGTVAAKTLPPKPKVVAGNYFTTKPLVRFGNRGFDSYEWVSTERWRWVIKGEGRTVRSGWKPLNHTYSLRLLPGKYTVKRLYYQRAKDRAELWTFTEWRGMKCSVTPGASQPRPDNSGYVDHQSPVSCSYDEEFFPWNGVIQWSSLGPGDSPYPWQADLDGFLEEHDTTWLTPSSTGIRTRWSKARTFIVRNKNKKCVSRSETRAIRLGMSLQQVRQIVGSKGYVDVRGAVTVRSWYGCVGTGDITVGFIGGRVASIVY